MRLAGFSEREHAIDDRPDPSGPKVVAEARHE